MNQIKLEVERISEDLFEIINEPANRCFYITRDSGYCVLDEFILDMELCDDDAHISSENYDTFDAALDEIVNRCQDILK